MNTPLSSVLTSLGCVSVLMCAMMAVAVFRCSSRCRTTSAAMAGGRPAWKSRAESEREASRSVMVSAAAEEEETAEEDVDVGEMADSLELLVILTGPYQRMDT